MIYGKSWYGVRGYPDQDSGQFRSTVGCSTPQSLSLSLQPERGASWLCHLASIGGVVPFVGSYLEE